MHTQKKITGIITLMLMRVAEDSKKYIIALILSYLGATDKKITCAGARNRTHNAYETNV